MAEESEVSDTPLPLESAKAALSKVKDGIRWRRVQAKDMEEILTNEVFLSNMTVTTEKGETLLHLVSEGSSSKAFTSVLLAYKSAKLLHTALEMKTVNGWNPLQLVVFNSGSIENLALLFSECSQNFPEAITDSKDGYTLLHMACSSFLKQSVSTLKYLLSQELCQPMLMVEWSNRRGYKELPMDVINSIVRSIETNLKSLAMQSSMFQHKNEQILKMHRAGIERTVEQKKKELEIAKEMLSVIQQPTMEAKARNAERVAMEMERQKKEEMEGRVAGELLGFAEQGEWERARESFLLSPDEHVRKTAVKVLAKELKEKEDDDVESITEALLTAPVLEVLKTYLSLSEDDPVLISTLKLVVRLSSSVKGSELLLCPGTSGGESDKKVEPIGIDGLVLPWLSSLRADVQCPAASALLNFTLHAPSGFVASDAWTQPLLLVQLFSRYLEARSIASEVLDKLSWNGKRPDPGTWGVREVSLWMASLENLDKRLEYQEKFAESGIDGLQLLELSSSEMAALGVKFVSEQRKLSNCIDELRRMNLRTVVGKQDVFLSYPHVVIQFAKQLKEALNNAHYTVWIDEAGIRAGHKWRNEIAHGIQDCQAMVFVLTQRSANSEYCQDEIALAEEYKKPIVTVRREAVSEMDPGLKLIIQRRQWIDMVDVEGGSESLAAKCAELVAAIRSTIGTGSGVVRGEGKEDEEDSSLSDHSHDPLGPTPTPTSTHTTHNKMEGGGGEAEREGGGGGEGWEGEIRDIRESLRQMMSYLQSIDARLRCLENKER